MEIVRDWKKEKERRKIKKQQKLVKKQVRRQNAKRRYQKELLRKPSFIREAGRVLPIFLLFAIVADLLFTASASDYYKNLANKQLEYAKEWGYKYVDKITSLNEGELDFNQVKVVDGFPYADTGDEDKNLKLDLAISYLDIMSTSIGGDLHPSFYNGILDAIYFQYLGRKELKAFYEYENAAYDMMIYNRNGVLIAGKDKNDLFKSVKFDTEVWNISQYTAFARLDMQRINEVYPDFYDRIADYGMEITSKKCSLELDSYDCYIFGAYVLPKKVEVIKNRGINVREPMKEVVETFDLSGCDFTGYVPLREDQMDRLILTTDYRESVHHKYYKSLPGDYIQDIVTSRKGEDFMDRTYTYANKFGQYKSLSFFGTPDDSLVVVVAMDYNLFRDWKPILIKVYGLSFLLAMMLLGIYAEIRYHKKKISYEVETYRRTTANAMAHDLKSPLMAISGYAENMMESGGDEKGRQYGQNILLTVRDMDKMISNILELSKLENYEMILNKKSIQLEELIKEKLAKYEEIRKEHSLSVELEGNTEIQADPEWMGHFVDNLLSNAMKYSKEGSEIKISLDEQTFRMENEYSYELDAQDKDLLEPFVKGDKARNNTKGNGLGLSIAYNIACAHGFYFKVEAKGGQFLAELNFNKKV